MFNSHLVKKKTRGEKQWCHCGYSGKGELVSQSELLDYNLNYMVFVLFLFFFKLRHLCVKWQKDISPAAGLSCSSSSDE